MDKQAFKIEQFDKIENLYLRVFHHGLNNGGITLVVVKDSVLKDEFILFLEERKAPLVYDISTDSYGFYVVTDFIDELSMLYMTSLIEIRTFEGEDAYAGVPEEIPYYITELRQNPEYDIWQEDESTKTIPDYPNVQCFIMNDRLKPMFLNTFLIAEREIDLICPWMNRRVVNEEMILRFRKAISRGVRIKICYGIGNDISDTRLYETEKTVEMLKNRFADTDFLSFNRGNTHVKYLICDDKYMMVGSYNLLSFVADYDDGDNRDEGMEFLVDTAQIKQRREQLFFWK